MIEPWAGLAGLPGFTGLGELAGRGAGCFTAGELPGMFELLGMLQIDWQPGHSVRCPAASSATCIRAWHFGQRNRIGMAGDGYGEEGG